MRGAALLADVGLPPEYRSYACRWVAYIQTHRVTVIAIEKSLPGFGDVVVVYHALKKPPPFENRGTTGVCLGVITEFLEVFLSSLLSIDNRNCVKSVQQKFDGQERRLASHGDYTFIHRTPPKQPTCAATGRLIGIL